MKRLVTIIPTLEIGGAERLAVDLLMNYNLEKYQIYLVILFDESKNLYKEILENYNFKIIYMNKKNGLDIKLFKRIYRVLNKIKPDVIHTHLYATSYILPWKIIHKQTKWVHTVHSIAEKELYSLHILMMKMAYQFTNVHVVAISKEIEKSILHFYKVKKDRITVIINGIDLKKYNSENKKNFRNNKINIVSVGRLEIVKNHILLLEAVNDIEFKNKIYVTIVGDGEQREKLCNYIEENKMKDYVKLFGASSEVANILKEQDVFILPSHYEGLPLSLLEAMAIGLCIVATNVGGIPDIIEDQYNGFLFEDNDKEQLRTILRNIINNKNEIERISTINKNECINYNIQEVAKRYEKIFEV